MSTRWGERKPKPDRLLVDDTLAILRDRYQGLSELVDARMEAQAAALKPNASVTVQCGMCRQQALAVGQHQPHCHFCRVTWGSPTSAAVFHAGSSSVTTSTSSGDSARSRVRVTSLASG